MDIEPQLDDWKRKLREEGYVVIPGVISKDKASHYASAFWKWLEDFGTGIDRDDPKTWTTKRWPTNYHGIFHHFNIGHEQFVWDVRSEENVVKTFADLWGTDELLVSFDGANLSKPTTRQQKPWPHVDQGPRRTDPMCCVQGLVNFIDNGPDDGGLVVYPKSHLKHQAFFKKYPEKALNPRTKRMYVDDWYKFSEEDMKFFDDIKPVKVCCKAGDMILWSSATVHYAAAPKGSRSRAVVYVCMLPASRAAPNEVDKKQKAFYERRMTSHWPCDRIKLFTKAPKTYGDQTKITNFPVRSGLPKLSERGMLLAGLVDYPRKVNGVRPHLSSKKMEEIRSKIVEAETKLLANRVTVQKEEEEDEEDEGESNVEHKDKRQKTLQDVAHA